MGSAVSADGTPGEAMRRRVDAALELGDEFSNLIRHLTERLAGQDDGRPKIFRDTAVSNLVQFFERFRQLNVRSSEQLDELVAQSQQIVQGVQPQSLRDNQVLRQTVASELGQVQNLLDDLLVDRPRRRILRGANPQREAA